MKESKRRKTGRISGQDTEEPQDYMSKMSDPKGEPATLESLALGLAEVLDTLFGLENFIRHSDAFTWSEKPHWQPYQMGGTIEEAIQRLN